MISKLLCKLFVMFTGYIIILKKIKVNHKIENTFFI